MADDLTDLDCRILELCTGGEGVKSSVIRANLSLAKHGRYSFARIYDSIERLERAGYLGTRLVPEPNTGPGQRHRPSMLVYTTTSGWAALRYARREATAENLRFRRGLAFAALGTFVVVIAAWALLS